MSNEMNESSVGFVGEAVAELTRWILDRTKGERARNRICLLLTQAILSTWAVLEHEERVPRGDVDASEDLQKRCRVEIAALRRCRERIEGMSPGWDGEDVRCTPVRVLRELREDIENLVLP